MTLAAGDRADAARDDEIPCPDCGYDLRGTESPRCPECGSAVDRDKLRGRADVPWQNREQIGVARAFVRTVWRGVRRPGRLALEADRDLDAKAAWRFRLICVLLAGVPAVIGVVVGLLVLRGALLEAVWPDFSPPPEGPSFGGNMSALLADGMIALTLAAGVVAWILIASGIPRLFFRDGSDHATRQVRLERLQFRCSV